MSGQIGTGVEAFAIGNSSGRSDGRFGIEDNASTVDRSVDMGGKSLSLSNLSEFNLDGVAVEGFIPFTFDEIQETPNMDLYTEVPFPGYEDRSMVQIFNDEFNDTGLNTKVYIAIDGQPTEFTAEYFLFNDSIPVYFIPKINTEDYDLSGYESVRRSLDVSLNVPAVNPDDEIQPKDVLLVTSDKKLRVGQLPDMGTPSWMDTLQENGALTANAYSFLSPGVIFNMYGTNQNSPVFYVSNNSNPILAKLQVGVGQGGYLDTGISFYNDHTEIRRFFQYQLDNNEWMVQFDRTIPDAGFVRGQWGYVKKLYNGASGVGSKDYYIELFPDDSHTIQLSGAASFKGKVFIVKVSGNGNVTLSVTNNGTINGKDSIILVPGTTIEVIHDGTEYRIISITAKIQNNNIVKLQTAEELNTLYPNAFEGFEVFCPNVSTPVLYRKTAFDGIWIGIEPQYYLTPTQP
ncbi:hypothetical protein [Flavobacterium sp. C4GT6]|uniref:hypothetical protein n=1 Tax=Flavobacterium sp. C4GT6 TaxID=3103818 RepID=UPI002ED325FF